MFPLHYIPKILYAESLDTGLNTRVKDFLYGPTLSHNTSVTDGRQTTDKTTVL